MYRYTNYFSLLLILRDMASGLGRINAIYLKFWQSSNKVVVVVVKFKSNKTQPIVEI